MKPNIFFKKKYICTFSMNDILEEWSPRGGGGPSEGTFVVSWDLNDAHHRDSSGTIAPSVIQAVNNNGREYYKI